MPRSLRIKQSVSMSAKFLVPAYPGVTAASNRFTVRAVGTASGTALLRNLAPALDGAVVVGQGAVVAGKKAHPRFCAATPRVHAESRHPLRCRREVVVRNPLLHLPIP